MRAGSVGYEHAARSKRHDYDSGASDLGCSGPCRCRWLRGWSPHRLWYPCDQCLSATQPWQCLINEYCAGDLPGLIFLIILAASVIGLAGPITAVADSPSWNMGVCQVDTLQGRAHGVIRAATAHFCMCVCVCWLLFMGCYPRRSCHITVCKS